MATIQKRVAKSTGKVSYRVQVRRKGHPPLTATFDKKTDAKSWAADREAEVNQSKHFGYNIGKQHKLHDVIEPYIKEILPGKALNTARGQKTQLEWWQGELGTHRLSDISTSQVIKSRSRLMEPDEAGNIRTPATINRYTAALRHVFNTALKQWELAQTNPVSAVPDLKEPKGRTRFLSDEERSSLLTACKASNNPYLHSIVSLAIATGVRLGNITGLKWEWVHFDLGIVVVPDTKNGEPHTFALSSATREILMQRHKDSDKACKWVFPNTRQDGPIDIRTAFRNAVKRAKIEDFTFHDLRHTTGSYLAMSGASNVEIADALNHKSLQMVKRYSHLSQPHAAKVLTSMNDKYLGAQTDDDA